MQQSKVKWFDAKKGYGFIDHPEGGDDVFVHYSQIVSEKDFKTLRTGQEVTFDLNDGPKGLHALDVKPLNEPEEADSETEETREAEEGASEHTASEHSTDGQEETSAASSSEATPEPAVAEKTSALWGDEEADDPFEDGEAPDPLAGPSF